MGEQQMRAVYRYEVPVDDQWHEITMWAGSPIQLVWHLYESLGKP
jgi:hypothetical protein